ncbi:MAG: carboxylesterase/lipase family protein [Verrucomicrobiota bacterium]
MAIDSHVQSDTGKTVKTAGGMIGGKQIDDLSVFLGIPYAAPPIGPLRWQPPQRPQSWDGVKPCLKFGPGCPQLESPTGHGIPWDGTDEDCLSLNVWTPAKSPDEKLPVMVWVHGGAFVSGGSSLHLYNGTNLSKKGVVVVTINYRLGPFGFLFGNFALMDQIAALKWVQQNISAFGGDPDCVTIFGESAGAFCILRLLISPAAKGLFQRAIAESGGYYGNRFWHPSLTSANTSAENAAIKIAKVFGCEEKKDIMECLRKKSAKDILEAAPPGIAFHSQKTPFGPVIDGAIIPKDPALLYNSGKQHDVPLIIGTNADEGNMFLQKFRRPVRPVLNKLVTALNFASPAKHIANCYKNKSAKAYLYRFTHIPPTPLGKKLGAHHGAEINYVFGNLDPAEGFKSKDRDLSNTIMERWINFAATGDPNIKWAPVWTDYSRSSGRPFGL